MTVAETLRQRYTYCEECVKLADYGDDVVNIVTMTGLPSKWQFIVPLLIEAIDKEYSHG